MFRLILMIILTAFPVYADEAEFVLIPAGEHLLEEYLWTARPLVIFADNPNDPRFVQQMEFLTERASDLADRDVVVITDTDPAAGSAIREELRPRGFMLVLIGKDGAIYLRKPVPWRVRELTRSIDKMPIRLQEMRDSHAPL
ncbi:MAG: DUF4174 domain-containing protein [Rhodobacteraceae bacterium]|nr:DUF4174 domain-containing protein [Paracoccaceae bacterium]